MCLIKNADYLLMTDTTNDFNLLLKLPFGITAVKAGFQAKLIQQTFVEPSGCQL